LVDTAQLNLVVIQSVDDERAARFYSALGLTFTRHRHGSGPEHYACESGPVVFEIYPARDEGDSTTGIRLGFRVASVADTVAALTVAGGTVVSPPKLSPWGLRAVIADPDGHRIELTEALPAAH
jgi:predicted enzyme related to lactoylglutathione lyase